MCSLTRETYVLEDEAAKPGCDALCTKVSEHWLTASSFGSQPSPLNEAVNSVARWKPRHAREELNVCVGGPNETIEGKLLLFSIYN